MLEFGGKSLEKSPQNGECSAGDVNVCERVGVWATWLERLGQLWRMRSKICCLCFSISGLLFRGALKLT